jgi:hypothetical protein
MNSVSVCDGPWGFWRFRAIFMSDKIGWWEFGFVISTAILHYDFMEIMFRSVWCCLCGTFVMRNAQLMCKRLIKNKLVFLVLHSVSYAELLTLAGSLLLLMGYSIIKYLNGRQNWENVRKSREIRVWYNWLVNFELLREESWFIQWARLIYIGKSQWNQLDQAVQQGVGILRLSSKLT